MSETKNLKLFKHDEPLSTNENEFDVDKSLNKNWDKVDDAFGKQNIDVEQLKRESFDFKNVLPSISGEGENIALNNTAEATFKKLEISGNSWQETRSGKNLFNAKLIANTGIQVSDDGKTITMPVATSGNGVVGANKKLSELCPHLKVGDEAYLFLETTSTINKYIHLIKSSYTWRVNTLRTITQDDLDSNVSLYGNRYQDGETEQVTISNLMITKENNSTWEQYGAMPSAEFPSKIQNCGDNINLLNIYDIRSVGYSTTLNGVDITFLEKGAIKLNGTPTKAFSIPLVGVHQSGNYKLDLDGNYVLNGLVNGCGISFFNGTNNAGEFTVSNKVIAIKQKIDYVILSIKANASFDNEIIYPCLRKGTVETQHSQFGQGNLNFKICNKNLRGDLQNGYWDNVNKTLSNKDSLIFKSFKIFVKAGTYTLSCNTKINIIRAFTENNNGEYVIFSDTAININSYTMTIEKDTTLYVSARRNDNTNWLNTDLLQLEEGETKTNFVEHKEQNLTFPLKQKFYKDSYLASDGIHHKRKQIELDGASNGLKVSAVNEHTNGLYYCVIALNKTSVNSSTVYSSHFKNKGGVKVGNCYITAAGGVLVVVLEDQSITTIEQANIWLAQQKTNGTPVVAEYELAVEELEEYNEEQKAVYDEIIKTAKSYKDVTHVFSTDEISCNFDVEAFRDLSSLFSEVAVDG